MKFNSDRISHRNGIKSYHTNRPGYLREETKIKHENNLSEYREDRNSQIFRNDSIINKSKFGLQRTKYKVKSIKNIIKE